MQPLFLLVFMERLAQQGRWRADDLKRTLDKKTKNELSIWFDGLHKSRARPISIQTM